MSNKPNDGGPAFPFTGCGTDGMNLRDYFAAKAMSEIRWSEEDSDHNLEAAKHCYAIADAMLAAREVKS